MTVLNDLTVENERVVHVRFNGRSFDVALTGLGVSGRASDEHVRHALARHLDVHPSRLADHVVDRHANGNFTLRPEAVFG